MDEIVALSIEDPVVRRTFFDHDIDFYLDPERYSEPEFMVAISKVKVDGPLWDERIHELWSGVRLGDLYEHSVEVSMASLEDFIYVGFDVYPDSFKVDSQTRLERSLESETYQYLLDLKSSLRSVKLHCV